MRFLERLFALFQAEKKMVQASETIQECPNCWGREDYAGQQYDRIIQENLNAQTQRSNVGWVQAYANKNFSGIVDSRKGNGNEIICAKCQTSYQATMG